MKITTTFKGGLGNQMFQFAFSKQISEYYNIKKQNFHFYSSRRNTPRSWGLSFFGYKYHYKNSFTIILLDNFLHLCQFLFGTEFLRKLGIYLEGAYNYKDKCWINPWYISGYWQRLSLLHPKYKELFQIKSSRQIMKGLKKKYNISGPLIAVHIRRGDFFRSRNFKAEHGVCDLNWYLNAIKELSELIHDAKFIIFTDDKNWVFRHIHFENAIVFQDSINPASELILMSQCDHFIISNSTFSWWSAMLSRDDNKIIIAPLYWLKGIPTSEIDLCPKSWLIR